MNQSSESKRIIRTTLMIFFAGILVYNIGFSPINGGGLIYTAMVLYWGLSVRQRPVLPAIEKRIWGIVIMMMLLLLLRWLRYQFAGELQPGELRFLWYSYYLPFLMIPLLSMDAAFLVGDRPDHDLRRWLQALYVICIVLIVLVLTNDLHQLAFCFMEKGRQQEQGLRYEYGPVYYGAVLWVVGCTAGMLHHLIMENRAFNGRRIPWHLASVLIIPVIYFLMYYLALFPTFKGRRILQLPEAYCISFICLLEYCLYIGWFPMQLIQEKEREIHDATLSYEKQNRMYESMFLSVSGQLKQVSEILDKADGDEAEFRSSMAKACVLTAYMKRRCNLVLKSLEIQRMPVSELRVAVAESLEYLRLNGVMGAVFMENGDTELPGTLLLEAYDYFEEVAELAMCGAEALMVNLEAPDGKLSLRMTLENPEADLPSGFMENTGFDHDEEVYYFIWPSKETAKKPLKQTDRRMDERAFFKPDELMPEKAGAGKQLLEISESSTEETQMLSTEFSRLDRLITAYTIEKEQLDARIRIHDDFGKMLLLARRYIQGKGDKESMLAVWKSGSRLLETEQEDLTSDGYEYMRSVAKDVGIRMIIKGELPVDTAVSDVVVTAIHECLTNTIRHAHGDTLNVTSEKGIVEITNNGDPPKEPIVENGGLGMLRKKAEASGIQMEVEAFPRFCLRLMIRRSHVQGADM